MDLMLFDFPTEKDGIHRVEEKLCELLRKYREENIKLDPIELDYMDWANSFINEYRSNNVY